MDGFCYLTDEGLGVGDVVGEQGFSLLVDALLAELVAGGVHRLAQPVGVEEEGGGVAEGGLLLGEVPFPFDADGEVGGAGKQAHLVGDEQRGVVPGVAVEEVSAPQVERADEEGDEHAGVVMGCQ